METTLLTGVNHHRILRRDSRKKPRHQSPKAALSELQRNLLRVSDALSESKQNSLFEVEFAEEDILTERRHHKMREIMKNYSLRDTKLANSPNANTQIERILKPTRKLMQLLREKQAISITQNRRSFKINRQRLNHMSLKERKEKMLRQGNLYRHRSTIERQIKIYNKLKDAPNDIQSAYEDQVQRENLRMIRSRKYKALKNEYSRE